VQTLVECVPNFSEGRDTAVIDAIAEAALQPGNVWLLDRHMDADHHRSVLTLVGTRESIGEAALAAMGKAAQLIDLRQHRGVHPRIGSTDVVPFVPIAGVTLEDCVRIAEWVAEQCWLRFRIPTYLYEAAARRPERRRLEHIRIGQFEKLRDEVQTDPRRAPDFGTALHPSAGATVVGARRVLIAFNVNLRTPDAALAKEIAREVRASGGGLPCVKAMGVLLKGRNMAQVSMNLTDYETTPVHAAFEAVREAARRRGIEVEGSEIVGLIPRRALEAAAVHSLRIGSFSPEIMIEDRLATVLAEERARGELRALAEGMVAAVAAPVPTPGGGSVSALAGALAAALGEMACGVSLKRKSYEAHFGRLQEVRRQLARNRARLLESIDRDSESYQNYLKVLRLPRTTRDEQARRDAAVDEAAKEAVTVPSKTAATVWEVIRALDALPDITIPPVAADLAVALILAKAALDGSIKTARANLELVADPEWRHAAKEALAALDRAGPER
jgi:glutamate formiminotransferase